MTVRCAGRLREVDGRQTGGQASRVAYRQVTENHQTDSQTETRQTGQWANRQMIGR